MTDRLILRRILTLSKPAPPPRDSTVHFGDLDIGACFRRAGPTGKWGRAPWAKTSTMGAATATSVEEVYVSHLEQVLML